MKVFRLLSLYTRRNPIILDKQNSFIFIPNNKVAQTSIVRGALKHRCIVKKDNNLIWHVAYFKAILLTILNKKYYVFTIVRNPYAMVFSAFNYLKYKMKINRLEEYNDFNIFVKELLIKERENIDPHFLPQSEKILYKDSIDSIKVHYLESLDEAWDEILENINEQKVSLPHNNANVSSKKSYVDSYDQSSYDIVYKLYKSDFEIFHYDRES